ncbi:MAG: hypothetical protein MUC50_03150 [Myxococcota bacterium]|jgi:hypothetical protein|nr:hypothetical protein [Myxococcota bacterium]
MSDAFKLLCVAVLFAGCIDQLVVDDVGKTGTDSRTDSRSEDEDTSVDTDTSPDSGTETSTEHDTALVCGEGPLIGMESHPADLVVVVDNSAKMEEEVAMIQTLLGDLWDRLVALGSKPQMTLITAPFPSADKKQKNGICVPAPLGSGDCPKDTRLPDFLHVAQAVGSKDALSWIGSTYAQWATRRREGGLVHFLVVSDDDADMTKEEFVTFLSALSPPLTEFVFHAITATSAAAAACAETPPGACCGVAAAQGTVYQELAETTGGFVTDLCEQDFGPGLEQTAQRIGERSCVAWIPG